MVLKTKYMILTTAQRKKGEGRKKEKDANVRKRASRERERAERYERVIKFTVL